MENYTIIAGAAIGGLLIGFVLRHLMVLRAIQNQQKNANQIINDAKEDARDLELEAKKKALEIRQEGEAEITRIRHQIVK